MMQQLTTAWPSQTSAWEFIKMHLTTHYVESIKRGGVVSEYCSGLFEHLHIPLVKQPYRRTNRKDATGQITKRGERRRALHATISAIPLPRDYATVVRRVSHVSVYNVVITCHNHVILMPEVVVSGGDSRRVCTRDILL
jgi:hypothetical protein